MCCYIVMKEISFLKIGFSYMKTRCKSLLTSSDGTGSLEIKE